MVETTRTAQVAGIGPEYHAFLYALIGADPNGTEFSVLSAMARMNLDPWQEATDLAALSATAATRRLESLIAAVPGGPSEPDKPRLIAARLVKLLPSRSRPALPSRSTGKASFDFKTLAQSRTAVYVLVALIALVLVSIFLSAGPAPSSPRSGSHASQTLNPVLGSMTSRRA